MSLFDSVNLSVSTKFGNVGLAGGKPTFAMGGGALTPPTPTPLTPAVPNPAAPGAGVMGWIRSNPGKAAAVIGAAVLGLVLILRR